MATITKSYRIHGLVQGFGFRPFAAEQAKIYGVGGTVRNAGGRVLLNVTGTQEAVDAFIHRLFLLDGTDPALPGAKVTRIEACGDTHDAAYDEGFHILESTDGKDDIRLLPPDIGICKRCERELFDGMNRRYRHPFISCTSCGPRYTIMEQIPYDREHTAMSRFRLCSACAREYIMPGNIRRHAQTIACKSCGPVLRAVTYRKVGASYIEGQRSASEVALRDAIGVLKDGGIIAVKNVGGYHFAHLATDGKAARRLREAKAREEKPFAVMFEDIAAAADAASLGLREEELLTSPVRPIVLVKAKEHTAIAPEVCGESNRIGAMLPADPIQMLLVKETGPLVMTSANVSGAPMVTEDEEAFSFAKEGVCDLVLYHDREILQGLDDSIYQVTECDGQTYVQVLRRARGLVPAPVYMGRSLLKDSFAAGGDLKASFAVGRADAAYLGGHFGDLSDTEAEKKRREAIGRMERMLAITPEFFSCDTHPAYLSAEQLARKNPLKVQHHHAHILSVIAEHQLNEPVLGVAFDGTGYGEDGTVWGGEFLYCKDAAFRRVGHMEAVPLAGGDAVAKDGELSAEGYLYAAEQRGLLHQSDASWTKDISDENTRKKQRLRRSALIEGVGAFPSSSVGRLFDAAAVIIGLGKKNHFEGQLACRLQYAAERAEKDGQSILPELSCPIRKDDDGCYVADTVELIADLVRERNTLFDTAQTDADIMRAREHLSLAFHRALACMTSDMCGIIADNVSAKSIALSGGTFANTLLIRLLVPKLTRAGFRVYLNEQVPCGDGGLALGQLYRMTFEGV